MAPVDPSKATQLLGQVDKCETLDATKLFASNAAGYSGEVYRYRPAPFSDKHYAALARETRRLHGPPRKLSDDRFLRVTWPAVFLLTCTGFGRRFTGNRSVSFCTAVVALIVVTISGSRKN